MRVVEHPVRPLLSRLFLAGMASWASGSLAYLACEGCAASYGISLIAATLVTLAACIAALIRKGGRILCICAGMLLGLLCAFSHGLVIASVPISGQAEYCVFELTEDAREAMSGQVALARVVEGSASGHLIELTVGNKQELLHYGQRVGGTTRLYRPKPERSAYLWQRGTVACARLDAPTVLPPYAPLAFLVNVRIAALDAIAGGPGDDDAKAVLEALVCGSKQDLSAGEAYEQFKTAGLAHLVAVSGAHLSIVVMLFECALKSLGVWRAVRIGLQGAFIGMFLVFAGAPLSAVRAALMAWASLASYFPGRKSSSLSAIGFLLLVIAAVSPASLCSVSLVLSAGSAIGIILFAPLIQSWVQSIAQLPSFAAEAFALTAASGVVSGPISACLFSQVSLVSPVANVLAVPLFSIACAAGLLLVLLSVAVPPLATGCIVVASLPTQALCRVVELCAQAPFACVPFSGEVALGIACAMVSSVALYKAWPKASPQFLTALGCAALATLSVVAVVGRGPSDPRIVMLDVGQGDAILLQDGSHAMLIDTGTNDALLKEALARQGVFRLDAVLITHPDDDHDGSLAVLSSVTSVRRALVARDALACTCDNCKTMVSSLRAIVGDENIEGLGQGDVLSVGRFTLEVVWPETFQDEGGNQDSLCLLAQVDVDQDGRQDAQALLVGDAESSTLSEILENTHTSGIDVFKVGHHGSKAAITAECAQTLSPAVALISVGENNRYGHPSQEALEALESTHAHVFRTDQQGDVRCTFLANEIKVTTQR